MFGSRISATATEKSQRWKKPHAKIVAWSYDMEGHVQKFVEILRIGEHEDRQKSISCTKSKLMRGWSEELVCSQIVLKCLYLARIGRPDILWSFSKFARPATKWTQACNRRLARLISFIHHTMLSRGKYCTALQIEIVPRLRLCCGILKT